MMRLFSGLGVAMVTPFTAEGAVDVAALRKLTHHLIDGGVDYLVPMGTTGESVTLSQDEKYLALDTILEENNGRKPVLLGCGGNNTKVVAEKMAEYATRFQPDGFLSVSPAYNKPTQEGIYQHYKVLANTTDLPIVLYNVPPRTGSNMTAETTLRLAHDYKNLVAIKEASGNMAQFMELLAHKPDDFMILSGDDLLATSGIYLGFSGLISVLGNALPHQVARMVSTALAQDVVTSRVVHFELLPMIHLLFKEGNPAGVKALLAETGITAPHVRLPLVEASDGLKADIGQALAKLSIKA